MQHVIFLHNKEAAFCGDTAACVCVCVSVCVHNTMINLSLASLKSYYKMLKTHIKVQ